MGMKALAVFGFLVCFCLDAGFWWWVFGGICLLIDEEPQVTEG